MGDMGIDEDFIDELALTEFFRIHITAHEERDWKNYLVKAQRCENTWGMGKCSGK